MKMCVSHLPCRAVVFDYETYFSHTDPPYLPELHPCDLCLFSRLKNGMKFLCFVLLKDIQNTATEVPTTIASGMSRNTLTNLSAPVDSVFVQKVSTVCVTGFGFVGNMLCTDCVQVPGHFVILTCIQSFDFE